MRYQVIISEGPPASTSVTVEAGAPPCVGEQVSIEGHEGGVVESVTHLVVPGAQGPPWTSTIEVRLCKSGSLPSLVK